MNAQATEEPRIATAVNFVGEGSYDVVISFVKLYVCDPQIHGDDIMLRHHGIGGIQAEQINSQRRESNSTHRHIMWWSERMLHDHSPTIVYGNNDTS